MVSLSSPQRVKINRKLLTVTYVVCTIAAASILSSLYFSANKYDVYAHAQQSITSNLTSNNILSTLGTAITKIKPDKVLISLGVETTNKTAKAALSANSAAMNKVLGALLASGVKQNETSTSAFSISPNYNYSQGRNIITGFTATNYAQIESSNINNTGKWIDTAVSPGGATTVNNINFILSDKKLDETKNNLIKQAINSARSKADIAASTLGLRILGVKSMSINEFESPPQPQPQPFLTLQAMAPAASKSAPPIVSGQQEVSLSVTINWLIR